MLIFLFICIFLKRNPLTPHVFGRVMVIVMMKIIILTVNGMGEIAVVQMWKKIIVIYVLVLILIVLIHVQNLIGKVSVNCQMIVFCSKLVLLMKVVSAFFWIPDFLCCWNSFFGNIIFLLTVSAQIRSHSHSLLNHHGITLFSKICQLLSVLFSKISI